MPSPLRKKDGKVEQEIAKYLDKYLYSRPPFDSSSRVLNAEEQLRGKDIIFSSKSLGIDKAIVDEKSSSHYVNKNIPTFAFELSSLLDNGTEVEGWLTDINKETQYYLLLWPYATVRDTNSTAPLFYEEDITKVDYVLVKRESVLRFLALKGFDKERLKKAVCYMRENVFTSEQQDELKKRYKEKVGFYFMITRNLPETPVNVILYRKDIENMALLKGTCLR